MSNKKSRKAFVTTAAAVMAASAVTPVAAFAAEKSFSDVPADAYYADAVKTLVSKGVITGYEDGTFKPDKSVTRAEAATILTKAHKWDTTGTEPYPDVTDTHWAYEYIVAATKAGAFGGDEKGHFNPESNLTRSEAAKIIVEAYGLTGTADLSFGDKDDIQSWAVSYVKTAVANGILKGDDKGNVNPNANITRGEFTTMIQRAEEAVAAPAVESVSAINATQVEVKFGVEVDKDSAETVGNYSINSNNPTSAKLGEDKKTVILTFASQAHVEVTNGVLVVEPITIASDEDKTTEKWTSVLTFKDEVKPEIDSIESKTSGTHATSLTVTATEPIASGLAKVNGVYHTISWSGNKGTITGLNLDASKSHTLELINLTDLAGTPNVTVSTSKTFNVTVDKVAPTATLSAVGDKAIKVTFSKPMDVASVQSAFAANTPVKDETLSSVNSAAVVQAVANTNDTEFIIPITASNIYANKDSRTFYVVLTDTLKDKLGNKLESTTKSITLTKDTVKPVATGYKVVKNNDGEVTAIEINFSEGLAAAAQGALTAPTIVDSNGRQVNTILGTLTNDAVTAGDKKVVFRASAPAKLTGQYAFSFARNLVSDLAETPNGSNAFNYTIDFGAASNTFDLTSANAVSNVITVNFGRAVKGGAVANSATDVNNYTLAGKPLPEGTTIVLNSTQTVATITLPASESIEKDDQAAVFTVANVHSLAGEVLNSYKGTVGVLDNTAPVLESAKVLDNKTIELTYSEAIQLASGSDVGDSFVIKQDGTELVLADAELKGTVASGFDNKLVIKINQGSDTPATPANAIVSGTNSSIVTLSNETSATANETVNYVIADNNGTLEVQNQNDGSVVTTLDGSGNGSFTLNGVTVTITGGADTNTFAVQTIKAVPATSATTLDLTKEITIETVTDTNAKQVVDKSTARNEHKAEVKVTVVKP